MLPLILPVETQVREFDAKLLLACVMAERGGEAYIGFQNAIRADITRFPRGVFIAKGFASRKARFMTILENLGHTAIAWDEEGLVHYPPDLYYERRMSAESLALLKEVLAWGPDYEKLIRDCPYYNGTPLTQTGNPRIDILRRELRGFFDEDVAQLHDRFGEFILVNSSFGHQNSVIPRKKDEVTAAPEDETPEETKWRETLEFRMELYLLFKQMVDDLAGAFPDRSIVMRPHPAENIETWRALARRHDNLHVVFEGNVAPWLIASDVLVHNGCTTAIEATLLDRGVIAYQPIRSEKFDRHMPNSLSISVSSFEELVAEISAHIDGTRTGEPSPEHRRILDQFIRFEPDRLASDVIVDHIAERSADWRKASVPRPHKRLAGYLDATARKLEKTARSWLPNDMYAPWHQSKQFPDLSLQEVEHRIARLARATGRFAQVKCTPYGHNIWRLGR